MTPVLPEPLVDSTVTRESTYLSAATAYRVHFQTINAVPTNGYLRLILPLDQVYVGSSDPKCYSEGMVLLNCKIISKTSSRVVLDFDTKICGTTGCAAGTDVNIVLDGLTNPSYFLANDATSSWQIYTTDSNKKSIDAVSTGLKALPNLIGKTSLITAIEL